MRGWRGLKAKAERQGETRKQGDKVLYKRQRNTVVKGDIYRVVKRNIIHTTQLKI